MSYTKKKKVNGKLEFQHPSSLTFAPKLLKLRSNEGSTKVSSKFHQLHRRNPTGTTVRHRYVHVCGSETNSVVTAMVPIEECCSADSDSAETALIVTVL